MAPNFVERNSRPVHEAIQDFIRGRALCHIEFKGRTVFAEHAGFGTNRVTREAEAHSLGEPIKEFPFLYDIRARRRVDNRWRVLRVGLGVAVSDISLLDRFAGDRNTRYFEAELGGDYVVCEF